MNRLLALSRAIDTLSDGFGFVAKWLVLLACLISAGNATICYLFNSSSNGWLEIQWYLFAGIVFLGAAQTLRLNEHVGSICFTRPSRIGRGCGSTSLAFVSSCCPR